MTGNELMARDFPILTTESIEFNTDVVVSHDIADPSEWIPDPELKRITQGIRQYQAGKTLPAELRPRLRTSFTLVASDAPGSCAPSRAA